ncbi:MAG: hypothetical protein AAGA21_04560 [Pseudomonadota bacterium]
MGKPEVKVDNCKVCGQRLANNLKLCIHCGAADPIKKKDPPLWPWAVFFSVIIFLLLI